ncbi:MAG: hypothetical protein M5U08_08740 [Burkholderiales bacterium]|nr:hypothetical protein [Burkholderiales bacterium]
MPARPVAERGAEHREEGRQRARRDDRGDDRETHEHDQIGGEDHHRRDADERRLAPVPRVQQGCRGARHESAEDAEREGALPRPDQLQCDVAGEAQARDQHDHQPDPVGVERRVRAVPLVGQDGQHDERQRRELQHRHQVAPLEALEEPAQLGLEVEERRDGDRQHHRERALAVPAHRAEHVGKQHGDHGRGARIGARFAALIGRDDRDPDQDEAGGEDPRRSGAVSHQRAHRAEERDQREGAQAGFRIGAALALDADQESDGEAGRERRQRAEPFACEQRLHRGRHAARGRGPSGCPLSERTQPAPRAIIPVPPSARA